MQFRSSCLELLSPGTLLSVCVGPPCTSRDLPVESRINESDAAAANRSEDLGLITPSESVLVAGAFALLSSFVHKLDLLLVTLVSPWYPSDNTTILRQKVAPNHGIYCICNVGCPHRRNAGHHKPKRHKIRCSIHLVSSSDRTCQPQPPPSHSFHASPIPQLQLCRSPQA